ncbi:hypothetical protein LTR96_011181 [Exophiala xenobiotica]|nr:hypothetical protein LTR72_011114 [Exophiala xenobiotica]KAK5263420.1 hypothetical protein LTR96_011181 [Exophiala xenobiotica]KAK5332914.1 hypothetical protein LTR98_010964 [Exophiala xenobiotica]
MGLFCLGPHLAFQADCLQVSLTKIKSIHRGTTWSFIIITTFHIVVLKPTQPVFTTKLSKQLYGVIAALAVAGIIISSIRPLRRPSYEIFLRIHQLLSVAALYAVWSHVRGSSIFAQYCSTAVIACLGLGVVAQIFHVLWINRMFYRGLSRSRVFRAGHAVCLVVDTPTPLRLRPGQYINLTIPGLSFCSLFQSHPFYVSFAQDHERGTRLELMIEPRCGWTSKLLRRAQAQHPAGDDALSANSYLTLFSGPHGRSIGVENYGVVILVASGWGLMAQMPYLQALIRGFHNGTVKAQRIYLVWQLNTVGM